ncbi:globin domain-containing protein [Streptomyces sp. NPDC018833]|uniref:globin domain-containing protein n=1 Tax=Streptomyces sp. NPDC018833 TaxID=3365053 RepID=UPI00378B6CCA
MSVVRDIPTTSGPDPDPEAAQAERPTAAAERDAPAEPAAREAVADTAAGPSASDRDAPAAPSTPAAPGGAAEAASPEHTKPLPGHEPTARAPHAHAETAGPSVPHPRGSSPRPRETEFPGPSHGTPEHGESPFSGRPQSAPEASGPSHGTSEPRETPPSEPSGAAAPSASPASPDAVLVRRTMAEIGPVADRVTSYFYALLFVRHPELRSLFPVAMDSQRDRLLKALLTAAEHMDNAAVLTDYLRHLGRGHRKYGTQPAHYPAVGEALVGALTKYATTTWDAETEAAWIRTYTTISQIMIDAAAEDEQHAPAWWDAEVVSHELRTPDIAIVTVRPDQPYKFLAGQYASLETPWWPRIWRHYSFAGAPRADGLLSFHIKAVPAGWVSNALVHHARPGDVLRLGPPAGSMTVDHTTDNGLLCLGGGTGIAPIKALVEDVATHGERRTVEVFYGARSDHDLYDIDTMLRLQQAHPWLSVRPVVDDQAQFPSAVRDLGRYGPWHGFDAYLSGPPGMIRSGVHALRGIGIPFDRIRHDALEELVAAAD